MTTFSEAQRRARGLTVSVLGTVIAATLLGCSYGDVVSDPPQVTSEPAPTTEPEPTDPTLSPEPSSAGPLKFPADCEAILPIAEVKQAEPSLELMSQDQAVRFREFINIGPIARAAVNEANQRMDCWWGVPNSDYLFGFFIAELEPSVRDDLLDALRESSYEEGNVEGAVTFFHPATDELAGNVAQFFLGTLWVTGTTLATADSIEARAVESVKTLNPSLVESPAL